MKRIPITLTTEEHEYLRWESNNTGLSIAQIIRILVNSICVNIHSDNDRLYPLQFWSQIIKARDKNACHRCENQFTKITCVAHHITPRSHGGKNTLANGMTLCKSCHNIVHRDLRTLTGMV